jgi:hypothetical protein
VILITPGLIGNEAAHRVGDKVPALGQFADGVVLIVRDAGSFKLDRSPPGHGLQLCLSGRQCTKFPQVSVRANRCRKPKNLASGLRFFSTTAYSE